MHEQDGVSGSIPDVTDNTTRKNYNVKYSMIKKNMLLGVIILNVFGIILTIYFDKTTDLFVNLYASLIIFISSSFFLSVNGGPAI